MALSVLKRKGYDTDRLSSRCDKKLPETDKMGGSKRDKTQSCIQEDDGFKGHPQIEKPFFVCEWAITEEVEHEKGTEISNGKL